MNCDFNSHFTSEFQYLCMKSVFAQALEYQGCSDSLLKLRVGFELDIILTGGLPIINKAESIMPFFQMNQITSGGGGDTEKIFNKNSKDTPLIVNVDVYYLPFRKEYKKYHAGHTVFFWDYDEENERVFLIDWYAPHFFKGYISVLEFKEARSSANQKNDNPFSGSSIRNVWFRFPEVDKLDTSEKAVELNIKSIFREENYQNTRRGISAVCYIKEYLKEASKFSDNVCRNICRYFHEELLIYYRTCIFGTLYFSLAEKEHLSTSAAASQLFCEKCLKMLDQINYYMLKGTLRNSRESIKQCQLKFEEMENLYANTEI